MSFDHDLHDACEEIKRLTAENAVLTDKDKRWEKVAADLNERANENARLATLNGQEVVRLTERVRELEARLPKLDRIFVAAQEWYGTVKGHLTYDNKGNCVDFGGMKKESVELVRALDLYHVWQALSPAPSTPTKEK